MQFPQWAGIRREGEIISATSRVADDGRTYYDLAIRMSSYASRNPYVATQAEVSSSRHQGATGSSSSRSSRRQQQLALLRAAAGSRSSCFSGILA